MGGEVEMMRHCSRWLFPVLVLATAVAATGVQGAGVGQSGRARQLIDGEQLFRSFCTACHGADAKGHGPAASALKTAPADLTTIAKRNRGIFPAEAVARYVANGEPTIAAHGSKEMPVWGPNFVALSPGSYKPISERIDAVVAYVESIQVDKP